MSSPNGSRPGRALEAEPATRIASRRNSSNEINWLENQISHFYGEDAVIAVAIPNTYGHY